MKGMDTTEFLKGLEKFNEAVSKAAEEGMADAIGQVYNDSVMKQPTVPHDEGNLRGEVDQIIKLKGDSGVEGTIVFKMPYADKQHEAEDFKHKTPGSGPKFLESKLIRYGKRYFGMIARAIRRVA